MRDPHTLEFQALQTRWRCTTHHGKFCYKRQDEITASEHSELDPKALSDWATAIVNKTHFVDVDNPPRSLEWDTILNPRRRKSSGPYETLGSQHYTPPAIHVHMPNNSPRRSLQSNHRYYDSPTGFVANHTPTRRRVEPLISSPILLEHESWAAFDGDGLKAFIAHCETKFRFTGTGFQEAYLKLRDHEIHPDIMRGKPVEWYEAKGIKSGIAERMVQSFNKWYAKMQQE